LHTDPHANTHYTILIADDSAIERKLVAGLLAQHISCTVLAAANGSEALSLIEREGAALDGSAAPHPSTGAALDGSAAPHPSTGAALDGSAAPHPSTGAAVDLVITDLRMPVMGGFELLTTIGERHPSLPVVVMTSQGSEDIAVQALQGGAAGYVPKRRLKQDLIETVESVLSANQRDRDHARMAGDITEAGFSLLLENDRTRLPAVIGFLQDWSAQFGLCDERNRARVGIALEEALLNGMIHGNLEVSSELRQLGDGSFDRLIEQRRREGPYRSRRLHVDCRLTREAVSFRIRDEGPGFDTNTIPDPTDPENLLKPSGRGLLLMNSFMDRVEFNESGNEVTMTISAESRDPRRRPELTTAEPAALPA
jgi:CheY-like chemotaxis protein